MRVEIRAQPKVYKKYANVYQKLPNRPNVSRKTTNRVPKKLRNTNVHSKLPSVHSKIVFILFMRARMYKNYRIKAGP